MGLKKNILDNQHWKFTDYKQRIKSKDWREILLNDDDKIIFQGCVTPLIAKNLGCGVYEVSKQIMETDAGKVEKALFLIETHGGIDGSHHKQWLLDQLVRVLVDDYEKWVTEWQAGEDGPETYEWDIGIPS